MSMTIPVVGDSVKYLGNRAYITDITADGRYRLGIADSDECRIVDQHMIGNPNCPVCMGQGCEECYNVPWLEFDFED